MLHCKKMLGIFPSPAGMLLTKLSQAGKNLIISAQSLFSDIPAGDEKIADLFLQCTRLPIRFESQPGYRAGL